ncbi:MAG: hypothetical protein KGK07_14170 [Chloroflexota bacterium]|nr:hypothetical protein [Chloroflexota bacterium]
MAGNAEQIPDEDVREAPQRDGDRVDTDGAQDRIRVEASRTSDAPDEQADSETDERPESRQHEVHVGHERGSDPEEHPLRRSEGEEGRIERGEQAHTDERAPPAGRECDDRPESVRRSEEPLEVWRS